MNKLIVVEGLDGSGKSTVARFIEKHFNAKLLKDNSAKETEFILGVENCIARIILNRNLLNQEIRKLLKTHNVILDRYFYSTIVYQCITSNHYQFFSKYNQAYQPDILIYCKPPKECNYNRLIEKHCRKETDDYEVNLMNNFNHYNNRYEKLMQYHPHFKVDTNDKNWRETLLKFLKEVM